MMMINLLLVVISVVDACLLVHFVAKSCTTHLGELRLLIKYGMSRRRAVLVCWLPIERTFGWRYLIHQLIK